MANARVVLFGQDPFEVVTLSDGNLRHQAEYELRSKLIQLRRMYIPASVSIEKLCDLMSDSLASFAALFRAVLMLHGEDAPVAKPECVRATARRFGLDVEPFEQIFAFRSSDYLPPSEKEANDIFGAYMTQLDRVIQVVDDFEEPKYQEK
jgi:hypothetical protein